MIKNIYHHTVMLNMLKRLCKAQHLLFKWHKNFDEFSRNFLKKNKIPRWKQCSFFILSDEITETANYWSRSKHKKKRKNIVSYTVSFL